MGSIPLYSVRKTAKNHYKDRPWPEILANASLHPKIKLDQILDEDFSIFHKKRLFRSYFESHFWNGLVTTWPRIEFQISNFLSQNYDFYLWKYLKYKNKEMLNEDLLVAEIWIENNTTWYEGRNMHLTDLHYFKEKCIFYIRWRGLERLTGSIVARSITFCIWLKSGLTWYRKCSQKSSCRISVVSVWY